MLYNRFQLEAFYSIINRKAEEHFNINTQYKLLKIKKAIKEELDIYYEQIQSLSDYFDRDAQGEPILSSDGGVKIKEEYRGEILKKIEQINQQKISLPDVYFSLDELEPLNFNMKELELIEPFIKT